jgi:hypothetical protein
MGNFKGTGIITLRNLLLKSGRETETAFLIQVDPGEIDLFKKVLPLSWVPITTVAKFFAIGAPLLCPGKPIEEGLRYIGAQMARDNLSGIYRVLIRILTVPMLITQATKI